MTPKTHSELKPEFIQEMNQLKNECLEKIYAIANNHGYKVVDDERTCQILGGPKEHLTEAFSHIYVVEKTI